METQNEIRRNNIREQRRLNRLQNENNDILILVDFLKMIILENKEN